VIFFSCSSSSGEEKSCHRILNGLVFNSYQVFKILSIYPREQAPDVIGSSGSGQKSKLHEASWLLFSMAPHLIMVV
jgi:hypothetical protein